MTEVIPDVTPEVRAYLLALADVAKTAPTHSGEQEQELLEEALHIACDRYNVSPMAVIREWPAQASDPKAARVCSHPPGECLAWKCFHSEPSR